MKSLKNVKMPDAVQSSFSLKRTAALLGNEWMERLQMAHVLLVGVGAVGGACAEALARSGVGKLTLVDGDVFDVTNLNRQPFSAVSAIGHEKTVVTCQRLADIAPHCRAEGKSCFVTPENVSALIQEIAPDVIVDAIDDVAAKVALLVAAVQCRLPVWSAMGAARKLDPLALRITDISKTQVCPLARNVRQQLRRMGIEKGIRCVWSSEVAAPLHDGTLGSYMPVTASAGLLLAAEVIRYLTDKGK